MNSQMVSPSMRAAASAIRFGSSCNRAIAYRRCLDSAVPASHQFRAITVVCLAARNSKHAVLPSRNVAMLSHAGLSISQRAVPHRRQLKVSASGSEQTKVETSTPAESPPPAESASPAGNENGASSPGQNGVSAGELVYTEPSQGRKWLTSLKLCFALPWRRFKKGSVLAFKIDGEISDQKRGRFDSGLSVPQICESLRKAALDPRVSGVAIEVGLLQCGWAKVQEIRRHLEFFKQSGKFTIAYINRGSEKEYYLASVCDKLYVPPTANLSLRGFAVSGTFLRGVLDKLGVEPQVKRIGEYKSAGDQLLRTDMSDAQREQLSALLSDIYADFVKTIGASRGKSAEEVEVMLAEGIYDMQKFLDGGWVDGLKYEDEIIKQLKEATSTKPDDQLKSVGIRKYSSVGPSAFGLYGKKVVAVLRTSGAIISGVSSGNVINSTNVIKQLRSLAKNKSVAAVVLRVDSPGGDALASDLMWREIRVLNEKKPVIASMGDVAASGGYYMAMAARKIVAEKLTITGSIGVVTAKFNLEELYQKIGYTKTVISEGRYAELLSDNRAFTDEEAALFDAAAQSAYESFRNKAAESRGMPVEEMQKWAQGRVWSGTQALERGLVDTLGGLNRAIALAKEAAEIPEEDPVSVWEVSRGRSSPLGLLGGGASLPLGSLAQLLFSGQASNVSLLQILSSLDILNSYQTSNLLAALVQPGHLKYLMTDVDVPSIGRASSIVDGSLGSAGSGTFLGQPEEEGPLEAVVERLRLWLE